MGESTVNMGTLYEFNQSIMAQMPPMDPDMVDIELANVGVWFGSQRSFHYFMLLNNDRHDYTVFNMLGPNYHLAKEELKGLLEERGRILYIEYNHDRDDYEIWVSIEGVPYMYILFPCNDFVIEIN